MTDFPDVKLKTLTNFPANVTGGPGIDVQKANGNYSVNLAYQEFAPPVSGITDAINQSALLWNKFTGVYSLMPILLLLGTRGQRVVTVPGSITALNSDDVIIVRKATGEPTTVNVNWAVMSRPLTVVDGKGDAATNNITITPALGQTQLAALNYSYVIDGNGGSMTLTPLSDGSGAY